MDRLTAQGLHDLKGAESELAGVPVERVVRSGEPIEEILLEADGFEADLIALTTTSPSPYPFGRVRRRRKPGEDG